MQDLPNKAPAQEIVQTVSVEAAMEKENPANLIVKVVKETVDEGAYQGCTESQRDCIHEIITTLAENGKFSLLFKQKYLKEMGAQLSGVHPLKFLSVIFADQNLKNCMANIFNDYFKKNGFMDGVASNLTIEADKGELNQYIETFSKEVGASAEQTRPFFENNDWEGLVEFLING